MPEHEIDTMDKSKYPDLRIHFQPVLGKFFPNLGDNYEVEAPDTGDYNCIAHTLGNQNLWVNPRTGLSNAPFSEMDRVYIAAGFTRAVSMDMSLEPGTIKVVVYAKTNLDGSIQEITHGAIQRPNGTYSSKLGRGPQVRHKTPEDLSGPAYGEPVAVYTKS